MLKRILQKTQEALTEISFKSMQEIVPLLAQQDLLLDFYWKVLARERQPASTAPAGC
jgi:hypothetical protein